MPCRETRGASIWWDSASRFNRATVPYLLLDAGLVDRVHLFYAPKLLGGRGSLGMFGGPDPERIADALELEALETEWVGPDLYVTGVPVNRDQ